MTPPDQRQPSKPEAATAVEGGEGDRRLRGTARRPRSEG